MISRLLQQIDYVLLTASTVCQTLLRKHANVGVWLLVADLDHNITQFFDLFIERWTVKFYYLYLPSY